MARHRSSKSMLLGLVLLSLLSIGVFTVNNLRPVQAADNDFSNGITVDSTGDGADANIGDGICDDGSGNCTLRAAIEESNDEAGTQTIRFNITGIADFTNDGQSGYTIEPQFALPNITDTIIIDGYSQPGSQANTATAPNPLNGRLLIELNGNSNLMTGFVLNAGSDNSTIRGLVINRFGYNAIIFSGTSNSTLEGSYLGTDPTGLIALPNGTDNVGSTTTISIGEFGGGATDTSTSNTTIGGLTPASRNVVAGNYGGGLGAGGVNTTIQGNYFGVGSDGVTELGNSLATGIGTGNFTLDYDDNTLVGGTTLGAANVISGSGTGGIQPYYSTNLTIQGNYIGTDYTGLNPIPNALDGITFFTTIGTNSLVGGSTESAKNIINFNGEHGIDIDIASEIIIEGNEIKSNGENGINITQTSTDIAISNNTISGSGASGIHIYNDGADNISIVGNSIFENTLLGIDLGAGGANLNDILDFDTGPNDLINFPTYDSYTEIGTDTIVNYRLDAPAGDYRIEFFSNTTQDLSGYGEGEEYLGYQNISHIGNGVQTFSYTLSGVTGVTNLALTTTQRNVATISGFGATSEFGSETPPNTDLSIEKILINPEEVTQGSTLEYEITITNQGSSTADLSNYGNPGFGPPLFFDFAPPKLANAQPYVADGPFPNSWIVDVSNPNLTCLWVEAGGGLFGSTTYADYGLMACYYTGGDTSLAPNGTITANFTLDLAENSDLIFNNYAFVSTLPDDPDTDIIIQTRANEHNGITIDFVIETQSSFNNISVSRYPEPVDPDDAGQASQESESNNPLANTGQDIRLFGVVGIATIVLAAYLARRTRKYTYITGR